MDSQWWTSFTGSACSLNSFSQHFLVLHPFGRSRGRKRETEQEKGHERVILIQIIFDEAAGGALSVIQFRVLTFDFETMS